MVSSCLKAVYAAVSAGLGSAATALVDGRVTWVEGVYVAIAAVGAFGVVWGVPNIPQQPSPPAG